MAKFELPPEWHDAMRRAANFKLPPGYREALATSRSFTASADFQNAVRRINTSFPRGFADTFAPLLQQWRRELLKIDWPTLAKALETARRAWEVAKPPNWANLTADEVMAVIERVRETGYCLVWLPRTEIIREVLASDPSDTGSVLLQHRDEVLDDADAVLAEVSSPELQLEREAARQAIAALRDGHTAPAQTHAATVFMSTAHVHFKMGTKAIARRMAEEDPEDADILELRLRTIYAAGVLAGGGRWT